MAETTYTYSIAQDFPNGLANTANLDIAIRAASAIVTALARIDTVNDVISIVFRDTPTTTERLVLDGGTGSPYGTHPAGGLIALTNSLVSATLPTFQTKVSEDTHYIYGLKTTSSLGADQVICSYTVPTGKTCYLLGYAISVDNGGATGRVKIGKSPVSSEPAAPGTLDGNIFRSLYFVISSQSIGDFSANPRKIGVGGDIIVITVSPIAITSTNWRASLEFVLR